MTDQITEQKVDFFSLPVAEEPEINILDLGDVADPNITNIFSGEDPIKPEIDYSVEYHVEIKDLMSFPVDAAHQELSRRVARGIEKMNEHIAQAGLLDCSPIVYTRPDWKNIGLNQSTVRIQRDRFSVDQETIHAAVARWEGCAEYAALIAMCTPGRNPLTGHGED